MVRCAWGRDPGGAMINFTRRAAVAGGAALGLAGLGGAAWAGAVAPVRRSVASLNANELESLRRGFMKLRLNKNPYDPLSFTFQANIHGVNRHLYKRIAPGWGTCTHGDWTFLPWHRMYLFWFERILRAASGDPNLFLPYWDYTQIGQRAGPAAFRERTCVVDGKLVPNPLYIPNTTNARLGRTRAFNAGAELVDEAVDADGALAAASFSRMTVVDNRVLPGFGGAPGRAGAIETYPHNAVHDQVGGLMGDPVTAGNDPIFWIHHCNVDRLWSVWQNRGGKNPSGPGWSDIYWTFYDERGRPVQRTFQQWQAEHGSTLVYDTDAPRPPGPAPGPAIAMTAAPPPATSPSPAASVLALLGVKPETKQHQSRAPLQLGKGLAVQRLAPASAFMATASFAPPVHAKAAAHHHAMTAEPAPPVVGAAPPLLGAAPPPTQASAPKAPQRVQLRLFGLTAQMAPGVSFVLLLNLPAGADPATAGPDYRVGLVNFFNATGASSAAHRQHGHDAGAQVFDITDLVAAQTRAGVWKDDHPQISVAPLGAMGPDGRRAPVNGIAKASIGRIEIVRVDAEG